VTRSEATTSRLGGETGSTARNAGAKYGGGDGTTGGHSEARGPQNDVADRAAAIIRDGLDIWTSQARIWYRRANERRTWSPEDVVGDSTNLVENLTPVAERSIELVIELLRPWAKALEARR
jgi:hypothetical protein